MSTHASPAPTVLRGRWLFLARLAWVAVAITALAIIVFSVPSSFDYYRGVCTAASEVCSERAVDQATPEGVRALQDAGLSVRIYALLNVVVDKVFQLVWFAVGALIFWRRSDDWMALLISAFLVSFGPVAVDTADAEALISSQPAWWLPVRSVEIVGNVCAVLFFLLFPSGRFAPRWTRWLAVAFSAFQVSGVLFPGLYSRSSALEMVSFLVFIGIVVSLVWSQTYSYRRFSSSGTTSTDKVGRVRHDPGCRGNLPLPAAGGPLPGRRGHTPCAAPPQDGLCAVLPARPIFHQRSRVALASVRYRCPHQPHPRLRFADDGSGCGLLRRRGGLATAPLSSRGGEQPARR